MSPELKRYIYESGKIMVVFSSLTMMIGKIIEVIKPNANELPFNIQPADGERMIAAGLVGALVGSATILLSGLGLSQKITAITKPK